MSLDAENFVEEGNVEAGLPVNVEVEEAPPVEEQAPAPEVQPPAAEQAPSPEEVSEDRSFIMSKIDKSAEQEAEETKVPLHVVTELRQKNRDLKQKLEVQANTRPAGVNADVEPDPLAELEDDDFLTAGQIRAARARDAVIAERQRQEAEQQVQQAAQQVKLQSFVMESEKRAKIDHPDFDAVMIAAEDYLTPDEFNAALRTKNPAKVLYAKAKQAIAALGIEVQAPVSAKPKNETPQDAVQTDDEIFDEIFGDKPAA